MAESTLLKSSIAKKVAMALSGLFLIWPTINVVYGAFFSDEGKFSFDYVTNTIKDDAFKIPFIHSIQISLWSAVAGGHRCLRRLVQGAAGTFRRWRHL